MTANPELDKETAEYVLNTVNTVYNSAKNRLSGSDGENKAQNIYAQELEKYCDETTRENFKTHVGAGSLTVKLLCAALCLCTALFGIAVNGGLVIPSAISLVLSLAVFCVFMYKFIFDGTKLDISTPLTESFNIVGKRYSKRKTENRVVLVSKSDAPKSIRFAFLGNRTPVVLTVCAIIGNTLLFCADLAFLFLGAPKDSAFFSVASVIFLVFIPFYILSFFVTSRKKCGSGVSSSILPSSLLIGIFKQFHDSGFRYEKTEICCLIAGCDYSSHAGSYAFAQKHKRLFRDVPTVFIPVEEITSAESLAVFFKDSGGNKGSTEVASVIGAAADNLNIPLQKENCFGGTGAFTPFSKFHFPACSLGTSKVHISKCFSENSDKPQDVKPETAEKVGGLLIETLNYYDG